MWCDAQRLCVHRWCCYISINHFNRSKNSCAPFRITSGFARLKLSKMTWLNCTCSNFMWAIWPFATQCTRHVQCAAMRCSTACTHTFYPGHFFLSMQINRLCAFEATQLWNPFAKCICHRDKEKKVCAHVLYCCNVIVGLAPTRVVFYHQQN